MMYPADTTTTVDQMQTEVKDVEAAQAQVCAAITQRYGRTCRIITDAIIGSSEATEKYAAVVGFEDDERVRFIATLFDDPRGVQDTYPLYLFTCRYAEQLTQLVQEEIPGAQVHVSASVPGNVLSIAYTGDEPVETMLQNEPLSIVARLLLPTEKVPAEAMAALSGKLAAMNWYGHYTIWTVEDAAEALELILEEEKPEEAAFASGVMLQYASFDVKKDEPAPVSADAVQATVLGVAYEAAPGFTIVPHDRYSRGLSFTDAEKYAQYFPQQPLTQVYAFVASGNGTMEIDLQALGIAQYDVQVIMLMWNTDSRTMEPVVLDSVREGDRLLLSQIPNHPFCLAERSE